MHRCIGCRAEITYVKEEVFCSECGRKNFKYLTAFGENNVSNNIEKRIKEIFKDDPRYLYFLLDNYNGIGQIYRSAVRIDVESINGSYQYGSEEVTLRASSRSINIVKTVTKQGTKAFDIRTSRFTDFCLPLGELLRTYPINGVNMHHTAEVIRKNIRHRILNELTGTFIKESTKEVFDEYMLVREKIESILEFMQPHPTQCIPKS